MAMANEHEFPQSLLGNPSGVVGIFKPGPPQFDPMKILRIHGYKNMEKIRPVIRKTAAEIAERAAGVMTPVIHFKRMAVAECSGEGLRLENGLAFTNPAFIRYLYEAREVVTVVITVGKGLDDEVIDFMDRFEPLEALFMETAGWLGIEWTTKKFVEFFNAGTKAEGRRLTMRMGPGYSYKVDGVEVMWSLDEQRQLFKTFDDVDLPVQLMESCAMFPKMSRSGLYGLVPENRSKNDLPDQGHPEQGLS
jgi:hypothetical protein